jgi:acyl carrier protein
MFNEIISSLSDSTRERIKNPFFGAFIISWFLINWDISFTFIWGNIKIDELITRVQNQGFIKLYLLPFTSSFLYIVLGPWIGHCVQILRNKAVIKSKNYKFQQENEILQNKAVIIETEAKNEGLKEKIKIETEFKRKEMELSIKEKEIELEERRNNYKVEKKITELESEKIALEKLKTEYELKSKSLNDKDVEIANKEKTISEYKTNYEKLETEFKSHETIIQQKDQTIEGLNNKLMSLENTFNKQKGTIQAQDKKINDLETQKINLEKQFKVTEKDSFSKISNEGRNNLNGLKWSKEINTNDDDQLIKSSDDERLLTRMKNKIAELLGVEVEQITLDSKFTDDLGADSLDLVELVMAAESALNISIPDEDGEKLVTVRDAYSYFKKLNKEKTLA